MPCSRSTDAGEDLDSTYSISSSVLSLPVESRRLPWARSMGTPIAFSTWDGSSEDEVQADPLEAPIPSMSRLSRIDSPSMYSKTKLALLGSLLVGWPVK